MTNFATVSISPSFVLSADVRADYLLTYSDFHKDAYGFRPRFDCSSLSDAQLVNDYETFAGVCRENAIAEGKEEKWHGVGPFDLSNGASSKKSALKSATQIYTESLMHLAQSNDKIVGATHFVFC